MEIQTPYPNHREKVVEGAFAALQKDFVVIGKTRVSSWTSWLLIGVVAGITAGILFVANRSGEFALGEAKTTATALVSKAPIRLRLGDVTLDGETGNLDGSRILHHIAGTRSFTDLQKLLADVDLDGNITRDDAEAIFQSAVGNRPAYPALTLGDVSLNGELSSLDATRILQHIAGTRKLYGLQYLLADVNLDGTLTQEDANLILKSVVGNKSALPALLLGDVSLNGSLSSLDSSRILQHIAGRRPLSALQEFLADVNIDGVLNRTDAEMISRNVVGVVAPSSSQPFQPSSIVYGIDQVTGKTKPLYCDYDKTRSKVAIIVKKDGLFDVAETMALFNQYFNAVRNHLGSDNVGVKKFGGTTAQELDAFIEELVKSEYVGYAIIVGADLPVLTQPYAEYSILDYLILDLYQLNYRYSYVGRTPDQCKDVALSFVFEPLSYTDAQKKDFVINVFSNFVNYHNNYNQVLSQFKQRILYVVWDDRVSGIEFDLYLDKDLIAANYPGVKFFYPADVLYNSDFVGINQRVKEKPFLWMSYVHGEADQWGVGLKDPPPPAGSVFSFTFNEDILNYAKTHGTPSLFIIPDGVCKQDVIADGTGRFCCWPQTWLKSGAWAQLDVVGEEKITFEKNLYEEKVVGNALKKTYHSQGMIYGDILAQFP